MVVEVTLRLPEDLVEHAKRFGEVTERDAGQVLADALALMGPALGMESELIPDIVTLTDAEVLALADTKLDAVQNDRLATLQARGKAEGLTAAEQTELFKLLHHYQVGQLRKATGMAEAVRRLLRAPLIP